MTKERRRLLLAAVASLAVLVPLGWFWWQSLVPSTYSVMDMGYAEYGGGAGGGHHHHAGTTSVADLVADPSLPADVHVDLVARKERVRLASDRTVDGYTLNGSSPGPTITARVGELVEVRLTNANVEDGVTLHWHGVDVPNAEDGVAGVTQDAVEEGREHVYRFVADHVGTYWYHSHQVSHEQVRGGLLGALVVLPEEGVAQDVDATGLAHTYSGTRTLNGREGVVPVVAEAGDTVRVRAVNTDNGAVQVWSDAAYRLLAVDGWDLNGPTAVDGKRVSVPGGGRADLEVVVPGSGAVRVQVGASTAFVIGPGGVAAPPRPDQPDKSLDLLSYGSPTKLPFDAADPDRRFDYRIGRRPGFLDGRPGLWWTINGHQFPDVPMYVVSEGDVVVVRFDNDSGEAHPMHLHGHHAVVLSRDGVPATGSPWWVDSVDIEDGETMEVAFVANNPGIWMDHCHNLPHAVEGLVAHLMYDGVSTPYEVGGPSENEPG